MVLKVNNIIDAELIAKLYEASTAGVRIRLLVRGICSLIPGVPGMSEHIAVTSIVGRYLEHARVLVFANGGDPEYFLSSADWMTRNLDRRVEVSIPVRDAALKAELRAFIDLQLHDTAKARTVEASGANRYVEPAEGAAGLASQDEVYRRLAAYGSLAAAAVAEPLTSIPAFASQS
jgi:polyphosphate kinase